MELGITLIGSVLILLIGVIGFFLKKTLRDMENRIVRLEGEQFKLREKQSDELDKLKMNYLDRFDKMKDHQSEVKEAILKAISELSIEIKGQKQFCLLMHEQKKEE